MYKNVIGLNLLDSCDQKPTGWGPDRDSQLAHDVGRPQIAHDAGIQSAGIDSIKSTKNGMKLNPQMFIKSTQISAIGDWNVNVFVSLN